MLMGTNLANISNSSAFFHYFVEAIYQEDDGAIGIELSVSDLVNAGL